MKKLLTAALLAFAPATAYAQTPAPAAPAAAQAPETILASPAMWVVRDDDTTIYLFGTFHMLDGHRDWFRGPVRAAFDASDELVLEAILPDSPAELQPLIVRYAVDPSGRTLAQRLTPEQHAALGSALGTLGIPAQAFEPLEPWFVAMTISALASQTLGISPDHGPEKVLMRAARTRDMPIAELEGIEHQLSIFDAMPEEQQVAQLNAAVAALPRIADSLAPMLAAWSDGDVDSLVTMMNANSAEDPGLHDILFTIRNRAWADWVQQRLAQPGTVFMAVGAGHLAGDDSVQALLAERGVSSERVATR